MKYNMGTMGEVEVPEDLIDLLKKFGKGCEGDCENCDSFGDCLREFTYHDRSGPDSDSILPEDVVDFMMNYHYDFWGFERIAFSSRIEVGEYTVLSFGIVPEWDYARNWEPYMIAYRKCAGGDDASLGNQEKRYSLPYNNFNR